MDIQPITMEADYEAALNEVERLFDRVVNAPQEHRLEVLTTLIEAYEERHYGIPTPDSIEAILYSMESRGLSRSDLEPHIGSRDRVSNELQETPPNLLGVMWCCSTAYHRRLEASWYPHT